MPPKTPQERRTCILKAIADRFALHRIPPTVSELAGLTGLARSVIHGHLAFLERTGRIRRIPGKARSIQIVGAAAPSPPVEATPEHVLSSEGCSPKGTPNGQ